jgi:hypothetical protein
MTLPRYITRANEQAFAPPYYQQGCALLGFMLPADRSRLQQVVDRFVTSPSGGRLRPRVTAEHVLLYFCDFARSLSLAPDDAQRGWLGERECGVWIPIITPDSDAPTFFVHSMFVDSGPAMCSGREVLGFPKELALVSLNRDPARASSLGLDVLAHGERPTQAGSWRALIELERIETGDRRRSLSEGLALLFEQSAELLGGPDADEGVLARVLELARRAGRGHADFVNLKQFRDAARPELACWQQLVRTRARALGVRRLGATGDYAYRIHDVASHPLVAEVGLAASGRTRGLTCDFDFELGLASESGQPT